MFSGNLSWHFSDKTSCKMQKMQTQAGWCFKRKSYGPALAPSFFWLSLYSGTFLYHKESFPLEFLTSRENTAASRLPNVICLCKIARIHLLFHPQKSAVHSQGRYLDAIIQDLSKAQHCCNGSWLPPAQRDVFTWTLTWLKYCPQCYTEVVTTDITLTGNFIRRNKIKKLCRIPDRISP